MRARAEALAGATLTLSVALLAAFYGLGQRDLATTELEEFAGSGPLGILLRSVTPTSNDWGAHMPLSHLVRWVIVALGDPESAVTWRLHTALASCAAALLTFGAVSRWGNHRFATLCGLLVAAHPIVSFHAHESTNYGFGPLLGGLLVLAILAFSRRAPRSSALLVGAVLLGLANDLFFVFPSAAALIVTALQARRDGPAARRRLLRTWGAVAVIAAPPALWMAAHLARLGAAGAVGPHADPIPDDARDLFGTAWAVLRRFAAGYLGGYQDAGDPDLYLAVAPAILFALIPLALWHLRDHEDARLLRIGGEIAVVSFIMILAARLIFGLVFGREFTTEPRIYTALTVPLVLGWAAIARAAGPRTGAALLVGLLLAIAIPTARQLATLSSSDRFAAGRIAGGARPGDLILAKKGVQWRLPRAVRAQVHDERCVAPELAAAGLPDRIWIAAESSGPRLPTLSTCDDQALDPLGHGWRLRLHERRFPPSYDRLSASFLPEVDLFLLEREAAQTPRATRRLVLRFPSAPLSIDGKLRVRVEWRPDRGGEPDESVQPEGLTLPFAPRVELPDLPVGSWVGVTLQRDEWPRGVFAGLLAPLGHPLLHSDPLPLLADPLDPARVVPLPALSAGWLRVLERVLRAVLAGTALLALTLRRGRSTLV